MIGIRQDDDPAAFIGFPDLPEGLLGDPKTVGDEHLGFDGPLDSGFIVLALHHDHFFDHGWSPVSPASAFSPALS